MEAQYSRRDESKQLHTLPVEVTELDQRMARLRARQQLIRSSFSRPTRDVRVVAVTDGRDTPIRGSASRWIAAKASPDSASASRQVELKAQEATSSR